MMGLTDWLRGSTIPHLCIVETKLETGKDSGQSQDSTKLVVKNVPLLSSHTHTQSCPHFLQGLLGYREDIQNASQGSMGEGRASCLDKSQELETCPAASGLGDTQIFSLAVRWG